MSSFDVSKNIEKQFCFFDSFWFRQTKNTTGKSPVTKSDIVKKKLKDVITTAVRAWKKNRVS